jgi:hypothetical protein
MTYDHRVAACTGLLLATLALNAFASQAISQESRIRFLDDLVFRDTPDRDPWEERIETERHDFTQSSKTVGRLVAQVESGYTYYYRDDGHEIENSHAAPETLLRIGLSDDIEFRVRWNYVWKFREGEDDLYGGQDLRWGFKLQVTEQENLIPESALDLRFTAPVGASVWTTGQVEYGLDYIYSWRLNELWILSGSTGYWKNGLGDFSLLPPESQNDNFNVWSQSVALGVELTERTTLYNEFFMLNSSGLADNYTLGVYNMGVDYYFSNNLVGDIRFGKGLTEETDDFFCGIGGGFRF